MYTIEDLKNGKCAVINNGTVEELNKILALIKWPFEASGSEKYYWKESESSFSCDTRNPNLPTQSVKDFIKQLDEEENKSSKIKSLYKVGDVISVKNKCDEGLEVDDYPFSFTTDMQKEYGNKRFIIEKVIYNVSFQNRPAYIEPFEYKLKETTKHWSAAMFNETPSSLFLCNKNKIKKEEKYKKEFTFSEDDIPSDFPYHPYVLDQGIQERYRQYTTFVKDAFRFCIERRVNTWFNWSNSMNGYVYWSNISENPNFIPANYTPKYFKSRQSKLPLCGVIDSEYQSSNLTKEKKDFMIPASYTEVELTIKKPICKF